MKKYFIVIIILLPLLFFSQKFTLSNLVNLCIYNSDDFDTFVTTKNYIFNRTEQEEQSITKSYSYSTSNYDRKKASYWISKTDFNSGDVIVSWTTYKKEDYSTIKSQIKANGFKYMNESNDDGIIGFHYYKGKYNLSLYVQQIKFDNSINGNGYEISITKEK